MHSPSFRVLISTNPAAKARLTALYQEIGHRVARARKKANLSQQDLATRIGLKRTSVTNIETGRQKVMVHTLLELAEHLGVTIEELLPREPSKDKRNDVAQLLESEVLRNLNPETLKFIQKASGSMLALPHTPHDHSSKAHPVQSPKHLESTRTQGSPSPGIEDRRGARSARRLSKGRR